MNSAKVVPLHKNSPSAKELAASLPKPVRQLREVCLKHLLKQIDRVLNETDDALFRMAEKTEADSQAEFFDAMRKIRMSQQQIRQTFKQRLNQGFLSLKRVDELEKEGIEGNPVKLSILDSDLQEEEVAVESMINKVRDRSRVLLDHLELRLGKLLPDYELSGKRNPIGPYRLCHAFSSAIDDVKIKVASKLVVLKVFDKIVLTHDQLFYEKLNILLRKAGVLPDLTNGMEEQRGRRKLKKAAHVVIEKAFDESDSEGILATLQELLKVTSPASQAGTNYKPVQKGNSNTSEYSKEHLNKLLRSVQKSEKIQHASSQVLNYRSLMQQALDKGVVQQSGRVSQADDNTINVISMLFEFVLEDRQLPDTMKAKLARLQIPYLRIAITDQAFLSQPGHSARRLLNAMASAATGWHPLEEGRRDPLKDKIEDVVNHLLENTKVEITELDNVCKDFLEFLKTEEKRRDLIEKRVHSAEEGKARSEHSKRCVQDLLNARIQDHPIPAEFVDILREGWSNYLLLMHLKHEGAGKEWEEATELTSSLIKSILPIDSEEKRHTYKRMSPFLLSSLREALELVSYKPFELEKTITTVKQLQEASYTGANLENVSNGEEDSPDNEMLNALMEDIRGNSNAVQSLVSERNNPKVHSEKLVTLVDSAPEENQAVGSKALEVIDQLTTGCWLQIDNPDGSQIRAKLATIINLTRRYVLVNRMGVKVADYTRAEMATLYQANRLTIFEDKLLFERALESIICNLRNS